MQQFWAAPHVDALVRVSVQACELRWLGGQVVRGGHTLLVKVTLTGMARKQGTVGPQSGGAMTHAQQIDRSPTVYGAGCGPRKCLHGTGGGLTAQLQGEHLR